MAISRGTSGQSARKWEEHWLQIGDSLAGLGRTLEAVEIYRKVADKHAAAGNLSRAIEVNQRILGFDPYDAVTDRRISSLYARMDAGALKSMAPQAWRRGQYEKALDAYRALAEIEGWNPMHGLRVGDCLLKLERKPEAAEAYLSVAERYAKAGVVPRALSAVRLVLRLNPYDASALKLLAELRDAAARGREPAPEKRSAPPAPQDSKAPERPELTTLGIGPLAQGEDLMPEDDFGNGTGNTFPMIDVDLERAELEPTPTPLVELSSGVDSDALPIVPPASELEDALRRTIIDLVEKNRRLEMLSRTDSLTLLSNRRTLLEALDQEFLRHQRFKTALALVLVSVDRLDAIAGTFGRDEADRVLHDVAACIRRVVRRTDHPGRFDDATLGIVAPGSDPVGLQRLADKIRLAVENEVAPRGKRISVSIGVALSDGHTSERLVEDTQSALSAARAEKRTIVVKVPAQT